MRRDAETMMKEFISVPDDMYTLLLDKPCLSDSLEVRIQNKRLGEDFLMSLPNRPGIWDMFLRLAQMAARAVWVAYPEDKKISFLDSPACRARFDRASRLRP